MINQKNFPTRRDGWYYIDGQRYVSVTTVLSVLNKPGLTVWVARNAAKIALADPTLTADQVISKSYEIRDTAGNAGTTIHSWVESRQQGAQLKPENLPEPLQGYGKAYEDFIKTLGVVFRKNEMEVYSRDYGYAGTLDAGTTIHSWVESRQQGAQLKPENLPEPLQGYGKAYEDFIKTLGVVFRKNEMEVYSRD